MLKRKVIRPSDQGWSAAVVLVTKKSPSGEDKVRMCIDYRNNSLTKKEYYLLPNMSDLLQGYAPGNKVLLSVIDSVKKQCTFY